MRKWKFWKPKPVEPTPLEKARDSLVKFTDKYVAAKSPSDIMVYKYSVRYWAKKLIMEKEKEMSSDVE